MLYVYLFLFIFMVVYWVSPVPVQIVLFLVDGFVPDPIPLIDEMLMIVVLLNRLRKVVMVTEFVRKHKILSIIIFVLAVYALYHIILWVLSII